MIPLLLLITAAISYFLGSLNGALILSRYVFRKDIRKYGSGNAGYTNFIRVFGSKWGPAVIAVDILKTVIAVLVGALLMSFPGEGFPVVGKLFAGFCALLGHVYPAQYQFRGGKGVVCCLTALVLADWRVGIIAVAVYVIVVAFAQYVSLASMSAVVAGMLATWIFVDAEQLKGLCGCLVLFMVLVIVWRHRGNIFRLIEGKEPKVKWGRRTESKFREEDF